MPTYLVEFFLPRSQADSGAAIAKGVELAARVGDPVRLVHALSVPGEEFCLCLYDAESAEAVEAAIRNADLTTQARPEPVVLLTDTTT